MTAPDNEHTSLLAKAIAIGEEVTHDFVKNVEGVKQGRPLADFRADVPGTSGVVTSADGQEIHWYESAPASGAEHRHGTASPEFLLIHGLGLTHRVWRFQQEALAEHARVVAIDLRGHGDSPVPAEARSMYEGMGRDVAAVVEQLDMHNTFVCGHSIGGMSMLQFAVDHPDILAERVSGLIALSTTATGRNFLTTRAPLLARQIAKAVDHTVEPKLVRKIVALRSGKITDTEVGFVAFREMFGENAEENAVEFSREMTASLSPAGMDQALKAMFGYKVTDELRDLDVETLVLHGKRDLLLPASEGELLATILPRADFVPVDGAGHMLMYEETKLLTSLLREFAAEVLTGLSPRASG